MCKCAETKLVHHVYRFFFPEPKRLCIIEMTKVKLTSGRYKEVCPYPDPTFTQVNKYLDIPETLLTDFTSGSTYHIEVEQMIQHHSHTISKSLCS